MRSVLLATALAVLAPVAMAQTYAPESTTSSGQVAGTGYAPTGPMASSQRPMTSQPDPDNCGTPDEPKACPPMPRRPLQTYPENRQ
jgi:hypothetical protein